MEQRKPAYLLRPGTFLMYLFPPLLIIVNYLVFRFLADISNNRDGFLMGMVIYCLFFCGLPFLLLVNRTNRRLLLQRKPIKGWMAVLLLVPIVLFAFTGPWRHMEFTITPWLIIVTIVYAIVVAFSEALLWRGMYYSHHQGNLFYAVVVPSIWFGIWQYVPLSLQFGADGNLLFIVMAMLSGLCWGLVTYYSHTILWTIISHALTNIVGFGAFWSLQL